MNRGPDNIEFRYWLTLKSYLIDKEHFSKLKKKFYLDKI